MCLFAFALGGGGAAAAAVVAGTSAAAGTTGPGKSGMPCGLCGLETVEVLLPASSPTAGPTSSCTTVFLVALPFPLLGGMVVIQSNGSSTKALVEFSNPEEVSDNAINSMINDEKRAPE